MSKNINVNPDHYKTAGRERPGQDIQPELERQRYTRSTGRGKNAAARRASAAVPRKKRR